MLSLYIRNISGKPISDYEYVVMVNAEKIALHNAWRYYRLEYHHPSHIYAIHECGIFCPPWLDRDALEKLFERPPEWADWEPEK